MIDVLAPVIGEQAARIVILAAVLLLIAALALVVVGLAFRIFRGRSFGFRGSRNRAPRLSVPDVMPVDSRRKLVLVRRDTVEHLLLVGGATDLVIETAIQRAVQQQPGTRRPVTAPPPGTAPSPGAAPVAPGQTAPSGRPPQPRPAGAPAPGQRPPAPRPAAPVAPAARPQPSPAAAPPASPPPVLPAPAAPANSSAPITTPARPLPPGVGATRLPTPAGRAAFPVSPSATAAAATVAVTAPAPATPATPPPEPPPAPEEETVDTAENEETLESSRVALAEAIERDFESMVPSDDRPANASESESPEATEKPASTESETESTERMSSRENEMAQLLGEIFGKK